MKTFWRHLDFLINVVFCNKAKIADAGKHRSFIFNVKSTKVKFHILCFMLYSLGSQQFLFSAHAESVLMIQRAI